MSHLPFLALLAALLIPSATSAKELRVVATVPDLAAVATAVGGDDVTVTAMALATQDPHFVDAKPSLALALSRADLLLLVGLDLEIGWLPTLLTGSRNPRVQLGTAGYLDCSTLVQVLDKPVGPIDRSMGDVHSGGNPHYLFDPRRAEQVALGVAARMAELDPERTDAYAERAAAFVGELQAARARWEERLAGLRGQPVITYHRSWIYLEDWLGFETVIEVEPKPGIPPSPRHIATVLATARQRGVEVLLQESFYPDRESQLVAEKAGARLIVLHGGTEYENGETYLDHMEEWVAALEGIGG